MSVDIYSPRVMIPAHREIKPVRTFLQDKFFAQARTYRTENVDVDVQVKGRRVAPFVNRWGAGKFVERIGFTTSSVTPPTVAMKTTVSAQDVSTRVMGENVYGDMDPEARARMLLADDLSELTDMLQRRKELMVRDVIFDSALTVTGDDVSMSFSFDRDSTLNIGTLTSTDAWTHTDSDPLGKIDEWSEIYTKASGLIPTDFVLGGTAYRTFQDNTKVKAKLDTLRIDLGLIRPAAVPDGARLVGQLYSGALRLWTYHEWYDDGASSGTTTAIIPAKKVLLASDKLRTEMRFGAVQDLTDDSSNAVPTLVETMALPRSWVEKDPPMRFLELRSRPLPVPISNHFLTAQVQA